jgi:hypothetical protein
VPFVNERDATGRLLCDEANKQPRPSGKVSPGLAFEHLNRKKKIRLDKN